MSDIQTSLCILFGGAFVIALLVVWVVIKSRDQADDAPDDREQYPIVSASSDSPFVMVEQTSGKANGNEPVITFAPDWKQRIARNDLFYNWRNFDADDRESAIRHAREAGLSNAEIEGLINH